MTRAAAFCQYSCRPITLLFALFFLAAGLFAVPPTPTGLTALAIGPISVQLSWNDLNQTVLYAIERSRDGFYYTQIYCAYTTEKFDSGPHLQPGTLYFYRVRAGGFNAQCDPKLGPTGWSTNSLPVSVVTPQNPSPANIIIEYLDPNPALVTTDGFIDNSLSNLSTKGIPIKGITADGVTMVLLRATLPELGFVKFCIDGTTPTDGSLSSIESQHETLGCVNDVVVTNIAGIYQAFALFKAPEDFNTGVDQDKRERILTFSATFTPPGGLPTTKQSTLKLVRPPLVFIHGLWDFPTAWTMPLASDARFVSVLADYSKTNAASFIVNQDVPGKYIQIALEKLRRSGVAATQADVIAHSMGGVLARKWAALENYKNKGNFGKGDINRLFTLDTPHFGSPFANVVYPMRQKKAAVEFFAHMERPIHLGAVKDLQSGSPEITQIPATPVPAHALVGTAGSDILLLGKTQMERSVYNAMSEFLVETSPEDVFKDKEHDFVVGRLSQEGDLPNIATSAFGPLDGIHSLNTGSDDYSEKLLELLNTSVNSSSFAEFPTVPSSNSSIRGDEIPIVAPMFRLLEDTKLTISQPASGAIVHPGQTVYAYINPAVDVSLDSVLLADNQVAQVDHDPPFEFEIKIPETMVGDLSLLAVGKVNDEFYLSNEVVLQVVPQGVIESLTIEPKEIILLGLGDNQSFRVIGHYSDGIDRDITNAHVQFKTATGDPRIALVSKRATITSVSSGVTILKVTTGELSIEARVTVVEDRNRTTPRQTPTFLDVFIAGGPSLDKVWLNDNEGQITDTNQTLKSANSRAIALADLDDDGDTDAVITYRNSHGTEVWENNGTGEFRYGKTLGTVRTVLSVLGDLDGDQDIDVFLVGQETKGSQVLLNDGRGNFQRTSQDFSFRIISLTLGDVDFDGDLDVFFVSRGSSGFGVLLNDGNGVFSDSGQVFSGYQGLTAVLGDIDKDGDLDAVVTSLYRQGANIFLNDGEGIFIDSGRKIGTQRSTNLALGDVNGDGSLDVVAANTDGPSRVWLNNGGGEFTDSGQELGVANSTAVALGDLDGDADLDAVITARNPHWNKVWLNDGTGHFTDSGQKFGGPNTLAVALGRLR